MHNKEKRKNCPMKIYTIGFTQKSAEQFFGLLKSNGIQKIIDIRVHPGGQLAGFAKDRDLAFFLRELAGIEYVHLPELAPTEDLMKAYRADKDSAAWEAGYRRLDRYEIQALLTAMALDLKRMVKLLYGVNFKNPSPVYDLG